MIGYLYLTGYHNPVHRPCAVLAHRPFGGVRTYALRTVPRAKLNPSDVPIDDHRVRISPVQPGKSTTMGHQDDDLSGCSYH
ncbi:hypothetical protein NITHO_1720010 [Nitrolancea hollandica Lb]|uniref:Uncharacterized protein n=1 Tax=Nitrolancea hollandica Lb TaxID=1129897 RepID=I4EE58_9BACT|nr:hypothetical protein NITHO_1720010 [Nitrolancea hollandica Lb]